MKALVIKLDEKRLAVVGRHGHRFILKGQSLGKLSFDAAMAEAERGGADGREVEFDPEPPDDIA